MKAQVYDGEFLPQVSGRSIITISNGYNGFMQANKAQHKKERERDTRILHGNP